MGWFVVEVVPLWWVLALLLGLTTLETLRCRVGCGRTRGSDEAGMGLADDRRR